MTGPPAGFPNKPIVFVGYQVIVGSFQVTLPASARSVTVSPEFVEALESGEHEFEVLAIEANDNQSITADSLTKPWCSGAFRRIRGTPSVSRIIAPAGSPIVYFGAKI